MITIKSFVFNFFRENTYLLYDNTKEAVIIDCGCFTQHEEKTLSDFIETNRLNVKRLLCTHNHFDHMTGNAFIDRKYGIRPELHRKEIEDNPFTLQMQASRYLGNRRFEEAAPARFIDDNEEVGFGNSTLKALLVPGHSPGSLAFYSKDDCFIISGDVLFPGSIGRTNLFGGNYHQLIAAINNRLFTLPDNTTVYSGHGPSTVIGIEKVNNPFFNAKHE